MAAIRQAFRRHLSPLRADSGHSIITQRGSAVHVPHSN